MKIMDLLEREMKGGLGKWFRQKWVDISRKDKKGKHPKCGENTGKGYAKCVPAGKAAHMTDEEKKSATERKRQAQRKAGRARAGRGSPGKKPIFVSTKPSK
jgi:hypothetical protein